MIKNAKITGTSLGNDDRGPSFWVYVDYGDSGGQGFGGYSLGGKFTHYVIMGILDTLEVENWENLKNTPVRIKGDNSEIEAIGHYLKDKWFTPSDFNKNCEHKHYKVEYVGKPAICEDCGEEL